MDETFAQDEKLYRAVMHIAMYIRDNGTLTSAAFKSKNGCSVDRGAGRSDEEAARFLLQKLQGDAYFITVFDCEEKDIYKRYEPTEGDPYHAGLYQNENLQQMTKSQCKYLAEKAQKVSFVQSQE